MLDVNGVTKKKMLKFQNFAQNTAKVTNSLVLTDHRKHFNPYVSRFGKQWETKMKTCTWLKPFVCITKYFTWITMETDKAFAGTIHKKRLVLLLQHALLNDYRTMQIGLTNKNFLSTGYFHQKTYTKDIQTFTRNSTETHLAIHPKLCPGISNWMTTVTNTITTTSK